MPAWRRPRRPLFPHWKCKSAPLWVGSAVTDELEGSMTADRDGWSRLTPEPRIVALTMSSRVLMDVTPLTSRRDRS